MRTPITARELMTPEPFVATGDTTLNELAYHMLQYDCGAIPIVGDPESRRLVGIVTDRDIIARAVSRDRNPMSVRADDVMSTDVKAVSPEASLEELIELFHRERFRRVPIVDESRRVIGIVTLADMIRKAPLGRRAEVDEAVRDVLAGS